jgi:lipoyl-dependent peroxiredoxin
MIKRHATAVWKGTGKEGTGTLSSQSTVLNDTPYSFNMRFGDTPGTNPEELIASAHAGCFAMKLSFVLNAKGFTADEINAKATVTLDPAQGTIVTSHLVVSAKVPGISAEEFAEAAADAKANCPISKSLTAEVSMDATLG